MNGYYIHLSCGLYHGFLGASGIIIIIVFFSRVLCGERIGIRVRKDKA